MPKRPQTAEVPTTFLLSNKFALLSKTDKIVQIKYILLK